MRWRGGNELSSGVLQTAQPFLQICLQPLCLLSQSRVRSQGFLQLRSQFALAHQTFFLFLFESGDFLILGIGRQGITSRTAQSSNDDDSQHNGWRTHSSDW